MTVKKTRPVTGAGAGLSPGRATVHIVRYRRMYAADYGNTHASERSTVVSTEVHCKGEGEGRWAVYSSDSGLTLARRAVKDTKRMVETS